MLDKPIQNATAAEASKTYAYALHIQTSPEKLWEALTSNTFIEQYWMGAWRFESDWQTGSELHFYQKDGTLYSVGTVIEASPPHKLVYTWPEDQPRTLPQPECLTWEISESGPGTVKLTLLHEHLTEAFYNGVSNGWPGILSNLKSLLETGKALVFHEHP